VVKTVKLVLVGDTSDSFGRIIQLQLQNYGYRVQLVERNGISLLHAIRTLQPEYTVMHLQMLHIDAYGILHTLDEQEYPRFLVCGTEQGIAVRQSLKKLGALDYFAMPFSLNRLYDAILEDEVSPKRPSVVSQADLFATSMLQRFGAQPQLVGYLYLCDAVARVYEHPEDIQLITKVLYPEIAKEHQVTAIKVERSIRKVIETIWQSGNRQALLLVFGKGSPAVLPKRRPSNSVFISKTAERMRLEAMNDSYRDQSL
jgi:two-component system response regulator (stage 0 sporulation protein A)